MASSRSKTLKLLACDIAAYSDAELDQYLEVNERIVRVEDTENLSKDFIQRLRTRVGASDTAPSLPVDLSYVSARLGEIPSNREVSPTHSWDYSTLPDSDDEEHNRRCLEEATEAYHELIRQGGRSAYPVSLAPEVAENPGEYREIFEYWGSHRGRETWDVFRNQLWRWEQFRERQQYVREEGRFPAYRQRLQNRLRRNGFERSFQLHEERDRQDKLATWIEFLNRQYTTCANHARHAEHLQARFDEAWKKLVDSKVLRPSEIEGWRDDDLLPEGPVMRYEEAEAKKAVESATLTVKSAEMAVQEAQCDGQNLSPVDQKMSTAKSKLTALTKLLELSDRRCKIIVDFYGQTQMYRTYRQMADKESVLLRWILQQVPLIELELNTAEMAENDSHEESGGRRRLKRNRVDELNEEPVSKRQRQHSGSHTNSETRTSASTGRKTSSTQQSRQTQRSFANPNTLPSNPRSGRALRASSASKTKSDSQRSDKVVLNESVRMSKRRRPRESSLGGTLEAASKRVSRRLAGEPPEFGMLSDQGVAPQLHKPPLPNISGPRNHTSSNKKPIPVKGVKPQGSSKSEQGRTNHLTKSKTRSEG